VRVYPRRLASWTAGGPGGLAGFLERREPHRCRTHQGDGHLSAPDSAGREAPVL